MAERQGIEPSKFDKTECIGMESTFREAVHKVRRQLLLQKLLVHQLTSTPRGDRDDGIFYDLRLLDT